MKTDKLLLELEELVSKLGYSIRKEQGSFHSDSCLIEGDKLIVLNKRNPIEIQVGVLANILDREEMEDIYIKPAVRKELEDYWQRKNTFEQGDLPFADDE